MPNSPINRERLLATFLELLAIDSPSRHEAAMAHRVREVLGGLGAHLHIDDAAEQLGGDTGNLIARISGTLDTPALLFCAHIDTVEPTASLRVMREDGEIRSDGTTILGADDKAGVAAILEMARALADSGMPHPPLELVFTVAEEVGLMGSTVLDYPHLSARCGFVPDTSGKAGAIIVSAPAQKCLRIAIHGRASHAGVSPEKGINAITMAARAIARINQGRIDEETTANIGIIRGGKATNIVPDLVEIEGEARSRDPRKLDAQITHMREVFEEEVARGNGTADIVITDVYPAFNLTKDSLPVRMATAGLDALGLPATVTATGGGSDANFLNAHGIATVILSAGYANPHSVSEYQDEEQLVLLAQWLYEIVRQAGSLPLE